MGRRSRRFQAVDSWKAILMLVILVLILSYPTQTALLGILSLGCAVCIYIVQCVEKRQAEIRLQAEQLQKKKDISLARLDIIDTMPGTEFEELVAGLLDVLGYQTQVTQRSRDGGADVIAIKGGERIAIQTKRYAQTVGISAVQEVTSSMFRYQCHKCMVITNSTFTRDAIEQAAHSPCILVDRDGLVDLISKARQAIENC